MKEHVTYIATAVKALQDEMSQVKEDSEKVRFGKLLAGVHSSYQHTLKAVEDEVNRQRGDRDRINLRLTQLEEYVNKMDEENKTT